MDVSLFDFELPEDRIALRPASPRDSARMLVVHGSGRLEHRQVRDLPDYLRQGDALVVNDTKVIPARLTGTRAKPEGTAKIEILLLRRLGPERFLVLARPARKLSPGDELDFGGLKARVAAKGEGGEAEIAFALSGAGLDGAIARKGEVPLPPYIARRRKPDAQDAQDYQTIFARDPGSVAAPTAGLHFTPELTSALEEGGVVRQSLTLHVGLGTFLPVSAEDTEQHHMHPERAVLTQTTAARLNAAHRQDRRITAVGTTVLRTLESACAPDGTIGGFDGETDIFITPGYRFRAADNLLTNFHLPRSTLFMLVSAFMSLKVMKAAYGEAVSRGYRFYSYGDACLLIRTG
ncbi:MAG: tRNA preQ1(34) S-adenosylmethionine ribosyltransferase-isomerase QueA [Rhizomicrobium sp.]